MRALIVEETMEERLALALGSGEPATMIIALDERMHVVPAGSTLGVEEPDYVTVANGRRHLLRPLRVALVDTRTEREVAVLARLGQVVVGDDPVGETDITELNRAVLDAVRDGASRIDCRELLAELRTERRRRMQREQYDLRLLADAAR